MSKNVRVTISISPEVAAALHAVVGQLKARAVRGGQRAEDVTISTVSEAGLRTEIAKQRKKLGA